MCQSMVDIQPTAAEIRRGKKEEEEDRKKLEMWANVQRDGRPAEQGGTLCSTPRSLADAHYLTAVQ